MANLTQEELNAAAILDHMSEIRVRELCIQAVRAVRRSGDRASTIKIDPNTIARHLWPLVREAGRVAADHPLPPLGDDSLNKLWATKLLLFVVWMQRTGLAFLYARTSDNAVRGIRLLPAGLAFFDADPDDTHPLVPGWLSRLERRCPGLPPDYIELMDDANSCFENGLLRPAVALIGVSFEAAIVTIHESLLARARSLTPQNVRNAAERIEAVRSGIAAQFPSDSGPQKERRGAATRGCEFADALRRRRNDAAHATPRHPFDDQQEVEEMLVGAARNLPGLWAMMT